MRIKLRGAIILIALSVVMGSVAVGVAQRVGGYKEVAQDSPEVEAAAEFAVKEQSRKQDFQYLQKEYSLTSWAHEDCGEDETAKNHVR